MMIQVLLAIITMYYYAPRTCMLLFWRKVISVTTFQTDVKQYLDFLSVHANLGHMFLRGITNYMEHIVCHLNRTPVHGFACLANIVVMY